MVHDPIPPSAPRPIYDTERATDDTHGTPHNPDIGSPRRRAGGPAQRSSWRSWLMILAVIVLALIALEFFTGWGQGYVLGTGTMDVDATPNVSADVSPADPGDAAPAAPAD
jgi:hypothetical protein